MPPRPVGETGGIKTNEAGSTEAAAHCVTMPELRAGVYSKVSREFLPAVRQAKHRRTGRNSRSCLTKEVSEDTYLIGRKREFLPVRVRSQPAEIRRKL